MTDNESSKLNLDEFLFGSQDTVLDIRDLARPNSEYYQTFENLLDDEYLFSNVLQSDFRFFCEKNFKKVKIDNDLLTTRQRLQFTKYYTGTLLPIPPEKEGYVQNCWKGLIRFFTQANKKEGIYNTIKTFIKQIMIFSPLLRTEMTLQLIKFANNEILEEKVKVWQVLAVLSNYTMVPESFYYYLLNYIYNTYNSRRVDVTVRGYASFVFVNVVKNRALDDRSVIPTINQIRSIFRVLKLNIEIHFEEKKCLKIDFEVYETCEQVKERIADRFGINKDQLPMLSFYEVKENDKFIDENYVEDFVRLSDVLASWELAYASRNYTPFGDEVQDDSYDNTFKLYLRPRYYFPKKTLSSIESIENSLLICEMVRLLRLQRIKLDMVLLTEAVVSFCALMLKSSSSANLISNVNKMKRYTDYLVGWDKSLVKRVLHGEPKKKDKEDEEKEVNKKEAVEEDLKPIFSQKMDDFKLLESDEIKKRMMLCFRKSPCYKTQIYKIKFDKSYVLEKNYPMDAMFYVGPHKMGIFDFKNKHLKRIKFEDVKSVSVFKRTVVLILNKEICHINNNDENEKLFFESNQAENVYTAVQNYISLKVNGFFRNSEIKYDKIFEDQENLVLDFELLDHLTDPTFALENTNRYFKKKMYF